MKVEVSRYPGNRPGPDISSQLIVTQPVAVAVGVAEIDENCSSRANVDCNAKLLPWIPACSVVAVADRQKGNYRAMVDGHAVVITRTGDQFQADSNLVLERVKDD